MKKSVRRDEMAANVVKKANCLFIVFHKEIFYPSIFLNFFINAVEFAIKIGSISDDELSVIIQARYF